MAGELITFERWYHRVTVEARPNREHIVLSANQYYRVPPGDSVAALAPARPGEFHTRGA